MVYIATDGDSCSAESNCEESNDDDNDTSDDSDELEKELVTDIDNFDLLTSDNYIHVV